MGTPYRKPEKPPRVPPPAPRGIVVRRHDPEDEDAQERVRRKERALAVYAAEMDGERRSFLFSGRLTRISGLLLAAGGAGLCWLTIRNLENGFYYVKTARFTPAFLFVGLFLLAVGNAGARNLREAPRWVHVGLVALAAIGILWGSTSFARFLANFAL